MKSTCLLARGDTARTRFDPRVILLLAIPVALALAGSARADELWRENPIASPGGYSSQDARNPGGLGWFSEVADNFDAAAGTRVSEVVFWGGYVTPPGQPGHTQGFTIRFYDDNGGHPGTRLFERDVLDTTETLYQVVSGLGQYIYHSNLNPPFAVPNAGRYWVSVVAILARGGSANEPQWGWNQAVSVISPDAQQRFFSPVFSDIGVDMSFVLNGTVQQNQIGDLNCDGLKDGDDIGPWVLAVIDPSEYRSEFPNCNFRNGDFNGDTAVDAADAPGMVNCMLTGNCP